MSNLSWPGKNELGSDLPSSQVIGLLGNLPATSIYLDPSLHHFLQVVVFTTSHTSLVSQTRRVTVMAMTIVATSTGWLEGEYRTNTLNHTTNQVKAHNERHNCLSK